MLVFGLPRIRTVVILTLAGNCIESVPRRVGVRPSGASEHAAGNIEMAARGKRPISVSEHNAG